MSSIYTCLNGAKNRHTLRTTSGNLKKAEALSNRRLMKMRAVDKVLSDPAKSPRFPSLELQLRLCPNASVDRDRFRATAIARCKKALRNLHASERLTIQASILCTTLIVS